MRFLILVLILVGCSTHEKDVGKESEERRDDIGGVEESTVKRKPFVFHYGSSLPISEFSNYDVVFVQPTFSREELAKIPSRKRYGYISCGSYESGRSDSERLAPFKFKKMDGWPEYWLDVSRWESLVPIMVDRMREIKELGLDGFYCDNADISANTGLSNVDNINYLNTLRDEAKKLGLEFGYNNALLIIRDIKPVDFYVNEQCTQYDECWYYEGLSPVYHLEYKEKYCKPVEGHYVAYYKSESLKLENLVRFCE